MNCPYCNSPIRPGIIFCTECGKRLPQRRECPHCGKTYESVTTICPYCGKDAEAPVEKIEPANQQNVVPTEIQAPPASVEQEPQKKSKTIWLLPIAIVLLAAIIYGASEFLGKGDGSSSSSSGSAPSSSSNSEYESSNSSSSTTNQIPSWMVGQWKCNTQYGTITMTINSDGSGVSDGDHGTFTYEDGELKFRFSDQGYDGVAVDYEVDEANQRLGAGHGYYFTKVTNSSSYPNQSNSYDNSSSNNYASSQDLTLIGSIDNKYPITMDLEQNGSELRGSYYYNRNGPDKRLNVYGQLDGSRFRLQEYDNDDNNTGNFVGTYHNGMVTGTFSLPDGKTMSFDLEVVN